jgi:hypothetical protein
MVATWNVAASSAYYARGSEYYLGAKEPDGVWYAPAGDPGRLDTATVQAKEFARLYEGRGDDGQALISSNAGGKADQRVPAFDLTRRARYHWSRLLRDDLRRNFEAAQERAVRASLATIEREAILARRGQGAPGLEKVALAAFRWPPVR